MSATPSASGLEQAFETDFADIVTRASPLELGPPVGWPLKFRVLGPDYQQVRELSLKVANIIAEDPRTRDINLTAGEPQRSLTVVVNQIEARSLGMSSESIASEIALGLYGYDCHHSPRRRSSRQRYRKGYRGRPHDDRNPRKP